MSEGFYTEQGDRRKRFFSVFLLAVLPLLAACGPSFSSSIDVPQPEVKQTTRIPLGDSSIFIDQFVDARPRVAFAEYREKEIHPRTDVAPIVAEAIKQTLVGKGIRYTENAPVVLSGELKEWSAVISDGYPGKAECSAAIYVELFDPANKRIYSGTYKGFSTIEAPGLDDKELHEGLRSSMREALGQIAQDKNLVELISSF